MYQLEQGIRSPRDDSINWLPYEVYDQLADAKKEARKQAKGNNTLWRITGTTVIWSNNIDK